MFNTKNINLIFLIMISGLCVLSCGKNIDQLVADNIIPSQKSAPAAVFTIFASDSFDGRAIMGSPDNGLGGTTAQAWAPFGSCDVSGGNAGATGVYGTGWGGICIISLTAPNQNCAVEVQLAALPTGSEKVAITARNDNSTNWSFGVTATDYMITDPNSNSTTASPAIVPTLNDVMRIEFSGTSIVIKINGVDKTANFGSLTDTLQNNSSSINFGLGIMGGTASRVDNFKLLCQ